MPRLFFAVVSMNQPAKSTAPKLVSQACVTQLPCLKPGETRVLGFTLPPETSRLYHEALDSYLTSCDPNAEVLIKVIDKVIDAALAGRIEMQVRFLLGELGCSTNDCLRKLSEAPLCSLDGFRPDTVPLTDPRISLRGKLMLRATHSTSKGVIIGAYQGVMCSNEELLSLRLYPPVGYRKGEVEWAYNIDSYAHDFFNSDLVCNDDRFEKVQVLDISAFGYGNATALVNDPHKYPMTKRNDQLACYHHACSCPPANANLIRVQIGHWVFPFMVATADIPEGAEVTYQYGESFWACFKEMQRYKDLQDEVDKLRKKSSKMAKELDNCQADLTMCQERTQEVEAWRVQEEQRTKVLLSRLNEEWEQHIQVMKSDVEAQRQECMARLAAQEQKYSSACRDAHALITELRRLVGAHGRANSEAQTGSKACIQTQVTGGPQWFEDLQRCVHAVRATLPDSLSCEEGGEGSSQTKQLDADFGTQAAAQMELETSTPNNDPVTQNDAVKTNAANVHTGSVEIAPQAQCCAQQDVQAPGEGPDVVQPLEGVLGTLQGVLQAFGEDLGVCGTAATESQPRQCERATEPNVPRGVVQLTGGNPSVGEAAAGSQDVQHVVPGVVQCPKGDPSASGMAEGRAGPQYCEPHPKHAVKDVPQQPAGKASVIGAAAGTCDAERGAHLGSSGHGAAIDTPPDAVQCPACNASVSDGMDVGALDAEQGVLHVVRGLAGRGDGMGAGVRHDERGVLHVVQHPEGVNEGMDVGAPDAEKGVLHVVQHMTGGACVSGTTPGLKRSESQRSATMGDDIVILVDDDTQCGNQVKTEAIKENSPNHNNNKKRKMLSFAAGEVIDLTLDYLSKHKT